MLQLGAEKTRNKERSHKSVTEIRCDTRLLSTSPANGGASYDSDLSIALATQEKNPWALRLRFLPWPEQKDVDTTLNAA